MLTACILPAPSADTFQGNYVTTARNHLTDLVRFAPLLPGYQPREPQLEMADAVEDVIGSGATLLVEAETGTGKTLAYLVPALLSEGPTLVSTGTKSLQDQLFFKDLPMVKKALNLPRKVALLKGRANYLCPYRLELHQEDARFLTRETVGQMQIVSHWAARTRTGDIAELQQIPEDAPVWPWVTSTADNCLGTECPRYNECPLMKARKEAQEADLVVVNHHLFFADAALRGNGAASELLPTANTVIFDEAHQLPEIAAAFFADTLSTRQIQELGRDSLSEAGHTAADLAELNRLVAAVDKSSMDLRLSLGDGERREPWTEVAENKAVIEAGEALLQALQELDAFLGPLAKASRGMDACSRRASEQVDCLAAYLKGGQPNRVYWFETFKRSVVLHSTPLSVAAQLRAQRERNPCSWILTSATLSVGGRFEHIQHRLGLDSARTLRLESPFDFKRQAVFYAPEGLPAPNDSEYTAQLTAAMVPVINAARGRTFFLFTSHRALREAAAILRQKLDYPLLVQGEAGRRELLDAFREKGNAVLLGTSSFWEGIDVRGEALSCVIIDKLPFGSPGDPVAAARIEHINRNGGNAFRDYQLPQAVLALRQGAGRLIRDPKDTGLLVVADPRLLTRSYGKLFVNSLPNMTRTRKLDVVQRFFDYLAAQGQEAGKMES
ncbi:MAG: ATP-dependent DNA helicase DinG [Alcanivorax borkumensis]|jgi:ATP-dependent DNA helicase DinG|uniref:DNA 5'-3' helicase n=2 Tax=Alcanivorax TaxID=59753 RepID=Q0VQH3_ALCBS|nr:Probable ATP-dependent helicase [Alcanivorax borkumensis SK2]